MAHEEKNIDLLIQIANQYARENKYFSLAKLVKDTYPIMKDYSDKLEPEVGKLVNHYQNKKYSN